MKIAFGTVVYKESFQYFHDYVESVNGQDYEKFDVLLINDNLDDFELTELTHHLEKKTLVFKNDEERTPSELRVLLMKKAKEEKYDLLILGDFDDQYSLNRVSKIANNFDENYSFFYNDLYYFDQKKMFFKALPTYTESLHAILECNYLGLSNTALNLNLIDFELLEKLNVPSISIFDWFMFSVLLKEGHAGKKIENCSTYYRIYENNIAGENDSTIAGLNREIEVKIEHYSRLKNKDIIYDNLLKYYIKLKDKIQNSKMDPLEQADLNNDYWWGKMNSKNKIGD